ncbi:MAG: hypothetical protein ACRDRX_08120 [Pseudonocardiaceae bacterium]
MDTISPAVADAYALLRSDLYGHLDQADELADKLTEWHRDDVDAARKLIPDLVMVIRGLLLEHQPQPSGTCQICGSPWPCPVVTTIHALVKDPEREIVAVVRRAHNQD